MNTLKVGLAQISPVWLNKERTIDKIKLSITEAVDNNCELIVFGEAILPGYPFWLALTNGAEWNSKLQKEMHAHYIRNSINIENGDLNEICELAKRDNLAIYLGLIERASNREGIVYIVHLFILIS